MRHKQTRTCYSRTLMTIESRSIYKLHYDHLVKIIMVLNRLVHKEIGNYSNIHNCCFHSDLEGVDDNTEVRRLFIVLSLTGTLWFDYLGNPWSRQMNPIFVL